MASNDNNNSDSNQARGAAGGGDDDNGMGSSVPSSPYDGIVKSSNLLPSTTTSSPMLQLAAVAAYIGSDTILRFLYRDVIAGKQGGSGSSSNQGTDDVAAATDDNSDALLSYDKPMFLSYCAYVCFAIWGLLFVLPYVWYIRRISLHQYRQEWCGAMHWSTALRWCMAVVILLTYQNYFYMSGLRYVHVAISTAVGQSEAPFTVGLTVLALGRRFAHQELRGVLMCLAGIGLIVIPPVLATSGDAGTKTSHVVRGVVYTMIGASFFSVYQVFWQKFDEERFPTKSANTELVLDENRKATRPTGTLACVMDSFATVSIVGLCNVVVGFLLLLFMHIIGIETIELPPSALWGEIATSCFLSAFVDAIAGLACVVASAVVVAMSYPLTIPLSVVLESTWSGIPISTFGWTGWVGTVLVLAGIFFLESEEEEEILNSCSCIESNPLIRLEDDDDEATSYVLSDDRNFRALELPQGDDTASSENENSLYECSH
jgi:drug/metabolite transporter (DMT)-like permease